MKKVVCGGVRRPLRRLAARTFAVDLERIETLAAVLKAGSIADANLAARDLVEVRGHLLDVASHRRRSLRLVQRISVQRRGRSRSSTISISPREIIPKSAPNNACWSVTRIRGFDELGMKLLAYFGSLFFSSI